LPKIDTREKPSTSVSNEKKTRLAQPDRQLLSQWASDAQASSEFGNPDWSALQAAGEPDVEECGDSNLAWAPASNDTVEWLEIFFPTPVEAMSIRIVQTNNPGQIVAVELIDINGNYRIAYTKKLMRAPEGCPLTLRFDLDDRGAPLTRGLRISLDQSILEIGTAEIDAVNLVGYPAAEPSPDRMYLSDLPVPPGAEIQLGSQDSQQYLVTGMTLKGIMDFYIVRLPGWYEDQTSTFYLEPRFTMTLRNRVIGDELTINGVQNPDGSITVSISR
jgi:hypothetical protein